MTLPEGKFCPLPACPCAQQKGVVKSCIYMQEAALQRAEQASGMTREQAFEPHAIMDELVFEPAPEGSRVLVVREPLPKVDFREPTGFEEINSGKMPYHGESNPLKRMTQEAAPAATPAPASLGASEEIKAARLAEFRQQARDAFDEVKDRLSELEAANSMIEDNAGSARLRRQQRNAFAALSVAQFKLETAFDRVPPNKE